LFGYDDFGFVFVFGVFFFVAVVVTLAVDEGDYVGVLLDGAGFAEIAEQRLFVVAAALAGAGELGERDDGDFHLFGEGFEAAGDGGDFLGAVLEALAALGGQEAVMSCR
jgi:hypothetical protein